MGKLNPGNQLKDRMEHITRKKLDSPSKFVEHVQHGSRRTIADRGKKVKKISRYSLTIFVVLMFEAH